MRFEDEFRLSFYEPITALDEEHGVFLLRHRENGQLFVRKDLTIFNTAVYRALQLHPVAGIPQIAEVIEDGDQLIVIEEYVNGVPLEKLIGEGILQDETKVLVYFTELLEILKALHSFTPPIVHRDIKPANIIITPEDHVKLLDLNAAKYVEKGQARDTELIGTVGYAAPEQYGFSSSDIRTDIYAAGILLNVMLTGDLPQNIRPTGPWWKIIEKCTRMEPANRYQNVDEILYDLHVRLPKKLTAKTNLAAAAETRLSFRDFLPPGFRSFKVWKMVLATIVYAALIFLSVPSKRFYEPDPGMLPYQYTITSIVVFFPAAFFLRNYLDVWRRIGLRRIRNRLLQVLSILGITLAYMASALALCVILWIILHGL